MYKLDLEKAEEQEIKFPTSGGTQKKLQNSRKTSASLTTLKPLAVQVNNKMWKILKELEYLTALSASWETCMLVKKQ